MTYCAIGVDLRGATYSVRSWDANESIDLESLRLRCPTMLVSLSTGSVRVSLAHCRLPNARARILAHTLQLDVDLPFFFFTLESFFSLNGLFFHKSKLTIEHNHSQSDDFRNTFDIKYALSAIFLSKLTHFSSLFFF